MRIFIILMIIGAVGYVPVYRAATLELRRHIGVTFVLSFVTLIFAGMFAPPLLFFVLCVVVMATLTTSRLDAVCRYILLGALIPSADYPLILGGVYFIKISTLSALAIGMILALRIRRDKERVAKGRGSSFEDLVVILFFVALNLAPIRTSEGFNGIMRQTLTGGLEFLVPYYLLREQVRNFREFRIVMACLAACCAILSVYALYETAHGWSIFVAINENLGEQNVAFRNAMIRGNSMRSSTTMGGALMLGCYLGIGWIAMVCSKDFVKDAKFWLAGCLLVFLGELAPQSRGNLACLALAALILLIANGRTMLAILSAGAIGVIGGAIYSAARYSPAIAGFLNVGDQRETGDVYDYRQILFTRGMEEAAKHRWTGTDINSVLKNLEDIKQGQGIVDFVNTYLLIYLTSGVLVLAAIVFIFLFVTLRLMIIPMRKASAELLSVRGFALAGWLTMVIALAFMSFVDRMPVLLAISLAASRMCRLRWIETPVENAATTPRLRSNALQAQRIRGGRAHA